VVGGIPTALKNMKVNWDHDIPNMMGVKKVMFLTTNQYIIDLFFGYFLGISFQLSTILDVPETGGIPQLVAVFNRENDD
jgi:hypothetical protein